jgi:hypothetical protein
MNAPLGAGAEFSPATHLPNGRSAICSVDQWNMSGQRTGIRICRSASWQVSGIDAVVRYRPVSL